MKLALAHLFGDYIFQNEHMAKNKVAIPESTHGRSEAIQHAVLYTACHIPVTRNWKALAVIGGTHYVIDRYRLAKYVVWARNQVAPASSRYPLHEAGPFGQKMRVMEEDGYILKKGELIPDRHNDWLNGWLLFIADNTMHLAINYWATEKWQ